MLQLFFFRKKKIMFMLQLSTTLYEQPGPVGRQNVEYVSCPVWLILQLLVPAVAEKPTKPGKK